MGLRNYVLDVLIGRYLSFRGRLSRIAFWRIWLAVQLFGAASWGLGLFATMSMGKVGAVILVPSLLLYAVALASCIVRRLHDRSRSGWWLVPFFGGPVLAQFVAASLLHATNAGAVLAGAALTLAIFGVNIWVLVEIGFRSGARTENAFGAPA